MHACFVEQVCDVDEGATILARRRRIHDDQRRCARRPVPRRLRFDAKIATKARVGGRRCDRERGKPQRFAEPEREFFRADVGGGVRRGQGGEFQRAVAATRDAPG
jgi:hypothetical protein